MKALAKTLALCLFVRPVYASEDWPKRAEDFEVRSVAGPGRFSIRNGQPGGPSAEFGRTDPEKGAPDRRNGIPGADAKAAPGETPAPRQGALPNSAARSGIALGFAVFAMSVAAFALAAYAFAKEYFP